MIAASVANFKHLIFEMAGSKTPAALLSRIFPSIRSKPYLKNGIFNLLIFTNNKEANYHLYLPCCSGLS